MAQTLRRIQMMQAEIEGLRRERVLLREALAGVVHAVDVKAARADALKVLMELPATAPWDGYQFAAPAAGGSGVPGVGGGRSGGR